MSRMMNLEMPSRPLTHAQLSCLGKMHTVAVLIDSGADASLLDITLAFQMGLGREALEKPINATALDGRLLCRVTHRSTPVQMSMSGNHSETLSFHLIHAPHQPVILGFPWLRRHNPHIDWASGTIREWSAHCHAVCLRSSSSIDSSQPSISECEDLSGVPKDYWDLKEAFNKVRATSLPPHRANDCPIDLLPGTSPPRGRLFSLSAPETKSM